MLHKRKRDEGYKKETFLCAQIPGKGKAIRGSREAELATEVAQLKKCMGDLTKQIAEKDGRRQADEVLEAERAVKEEAMKRPELLSLDILHQKLVRLEGTQGQP